MEGGPFAVPRESRLPTTNAHPAATSRARHRGEVLEEYSCDNPGGLALGSEQGVIAGVKLLGAAHYPKGIDGPRLAHVRGHAGDLTFTRMPSYMGKVRGP